MEFGDRFKVKKQFKIMKDDGEQLANYLEGFIYRVTPINQPHIEAALAAGSVTMEAGGGAVEIGPGMKAAAAGARASGRFSTSKKGR